MKKTLFCFLILSFFIQNLLGLEVFINSGIKNQKPITILHIKNKTDFTCDEKIKDAQKYYECVVKGKTKLLSNQHLKEFDLIFKNNEKHLIITIYPKIKSYLQNSDNVLYKTGYFLHKNNNTAKHFSIILTDELNLEQEKFNGLDFGFSFNEIIYPYIGALDLDQEPISFSKTNDIGAFLDIKKAFEQKRYKEVIQSVEIALNKYKDSIFSKDFILYLLRSKLELGKDDDIFSLIQTGKDYLRTFPGDSNYAEVLSIMVQAYLIEGQRSDAEYLLEILSNEHKDNFFTKIAKIKYADMLTTIGQTNDALKMYNEILFSTNNTQLISKAALALAKINITSNKMPLAKEYIQKVIDLNKNYLLEDKEQSVEIATNFFDAKFYDLAANIYQLIYDKSTKADFYYEKLAFYLANAYYLGNQKEKARKYLKDYQSQFPSGNYLNEVEQMYDSLYFSNKDATPQQLHEYYKMMLKRYKSNDDLAKRALEEELKLLYEEQDYKKMLTYTDIAKEQENEKAQEHLYKAASILINQSLDKDECLYALKLRKDYKIDAIDIKENDSLLNCYMRTGKYDDALLFINEHYEEDIVFYGLNELKILYLSGEYKQLLKKVQLLQKERIMTNKNEKFQLFYYQSLAFLKLDLYNDAIFALKKLEKSDNEFKIVEAYDEFLDYFIKHDLSLSAKLFGQKSVDLQNKYGINLYSPKHEFILLWALIKEKDYKEARQTLVDLFKLKLKDDDFTKAKFLSGEIYKINNDNQNAIKEYSACISGEYKKLCDDAKKILENEQN